MPPNIFSLGQDAFKDAYSTQQGMRQDRGRMAAGRSLAAGDRQAAMGSLGDAGLIDEQRQIQSDQRAEDNTQYERARADEQTTYTRDQADIAKRAAFLKDVSLGLKNVPAGQRRAALDQVLPHFQGLGIDPAQFASLTDDQLTDQALDLFSGEVDKQQLVNLGGGGAASFNQRSGEFKTLREPTLRPVIVGNGATALDPETGEPVYVNPKQFAPPRPRASGNGGHYGATPYGPVIQIDPNQVKWK